jgi:hypothetical protein
MANEAHPHMTETEEGHAIKRGVRWGAIGGACIDGAIDFFALKGDMSALDFATNGVVMLGSIVGGIAASFGVGEASARRGQDASADG